MVNFNVVRSYLLIGVFIQAGHCLQLTGKSFMFKNKDGDLKISLKWTVVHGAESGEFLGFTVQTNAGVTYLNRNLQTIKSLPGRDIDVLVGHTSLRLMFVNPTSKVDSGSYTVMATEKGKDGIRRSLSKTLTIRKFNGTMTDVLPPPENASDKSHREKPLPIKIIIIGSCVGLIMFSIVAFYLWYRQRKSISKPISSAVYADDVELDPLSVEQEQQYTNIQLHQPQTMYDKMMLNNTDSKSNIVKTKRSTKRFNLYKSLKLKTFRPVGITSAADCVDGDDKVDDNIDEDDDYEDEIGSEYATPNLLGPKSVRTFKNSSVSYSVPNNKPKVIQLHTFQDVNLK